MNTYEQVVAIYDSLRAGKRVPADTEHMRRLQTDAESCPHVRQVPRYHVDMQKFNHVELARLLREQFFNTAIHRELENVVAWIADMGPIEIERWIRYIRPLSSGSYGSSSTACIACEDEESHELVLKTSIKNEDCSLLREAAIGLLAINKVRDRAQAFMHTYGVIGCKFKDNDACAVLAETDMKMLGRSSVKSSLGYLVLERVDGSTLDKSIDRMGDIEVLEVLQQVFMACKAAHDYCDFTHYDLHAGNIMVKRYPRPISVTVDGRTVTSHWYARIIDYGFAHALIDGGHIGNAFPAVGVCSTSSNPASDVVRLCSVIYAASRSVVMRELMMRIVNMYVRVREDQMSNFIKIGSPVFTKNDHAYAEVLQMLSTDKHMNAIALRCGRCDDVASVRTRIYSSSIKPDIVPQIIQDVYRYDPITAQFMLHVHDVVARDKTMSRIEYDNNVMRALDLADQFAQRGRPRDKLIASTIASTMLKVMPRDGNYSDAHDLADAVLMRTL